MPAHRPRSGDYRTAPPAGSASGFGVGAGCRSGPRWRRPTVAWMATPASIAVTMPVPPARGMSHMIARTRSVRKAERSQRGDLVPQSTAGIPAENEGDETNDAAGGVQRQDVLVRPAPAHPQQDLVFGRLPGHGP